MGCIYSKKCRNHPGYRQSVILASETSFTINEVEALYVLFKKLSRSITGEVLINKFDQVYQQDDFQLALLGNCKSQSLIVDRVFNLFDLKRNGVIRFEDFVRSLSILHPRSPDADKIAFTFKLYDLHDTGYIGRDELKKMLLAVLEELAVTLADNLVEAILDKTFTEVDLNQDGKIDEGEWKEFVARNPSLLRTMTLPYLRDLTTIYPSFLINTEVQDSDLTVIEDAYRSYSSKSSFQDQVDQQ